ncbi:acyltransferase family protein [Geomonas subterranea]|uniref:acyltransferase family protein n=1 Tax=Geomonas subterranea TaxID=2847989 RepID=UPI001CD4E587|nr:acyltransferase [Geomonas fuzhouensis]
MRYSAALDGVRGIAVITVVLAHFGVPFIRRGGLGVDIFFTLSGFLITSILLHEFSKTGSISFKDFYLRRVFRLFPALLFLLIVYGALASFFGKNLTRHFGDIALVFFYVANWASAAGLNRPGELGHTWSLSVEEQFYIVWPCLFYFLLKNWGRIGLLTVSVLLTILSMSQNFFMSTFSPWWRLYYGSDTRAFMLLLGCCFAMLIYFWQDHLVMPKPLEHVLPFVTAAGIASLMLHTDPFLNEPDYFRGKIFLIPLLTCGLLYQVLMPGFDYSKKIISTKVLVYFGKRSYSLYLWHYWIMSIWHMGGPRDSRVMVRLMWAVSSIVITEVSYRYVELPFLSLKKKFCRTQAPAIAGYAANSAAA